MLSHQSRIICHECDALLRKPLVQPGQKASCPRCDALLFKCRRDPVNRGLALSLTALILFLPANFLPIMTLDMLGLENADTLYKGSLQLFQQGYWWMALLVFICSMLAPLTEFILITCICVMVKMQRYNEWLVLMLKIQSHVRRWGMLEVFMLSILVAYIKMLDMGDIQLGMGLVCFSGLLLATILNALLFDTHAIWEKVGQARDQHRFS